MTRASNHGLEVAKKEKRKTEKMVERQKTEAMAAKRYRDRRRTSFSSKKEGNYESDTKNDVDPDQANNKYLL